VQEEQLKFQEICGKNWNHS